MKDKNIDIDNYKKIIFVDASGDDGFVFKETSGEASSFCYVVSCLVISPASFEHNCQVLSKMKTALNLPENSELKSTTLKRHRFADDAYNELRNIEGEVFSFVVFKKELLKKDAEYVESILVNKRLSGFTHAFPLYALHKTNVLQNNEKTLIVIDHMKKAEKEAIADCCKTFNISSLINSDIIYRDSKSRKFPLIQLADAIAGTLRNYFEESLHTNPLQKYCVACKRKKSMCTMGSARKARKQLKISNRYKITLTLHKKPKYKNQIMLVAVVTLPFHIYERYEYINCLLAK